MQITHGSLFTGRGGFECGAEAAGIKTLWNCEIDPWLRGKLRGLYPTAKQYTNAKYVKYPPPVHILSAGFPCQDISLANQHAQGITGSKSGLWSEVARVIEECKPQVVIVENSSQLLRRGFEVVLSDLSRIGYNAEWQCLRASDFGYPHQRHRVYVIAYPTSVRLQGMVFLPIEAVKISRKWTPTAPYIHLSTERAQSFANPYPIPRNDGVHNFRREIKAYGNAVMPPIAEYLMQCAKLFLTEHKLT